MDFKKYFQKSVENTDLFRFFMFPLVWLFPLFGMGQTLILNEVSQGETGGMEYVELVVVDSTVTYNCANTTPPCIDIRGWIIDDNSGYHGGSGIAAGACRFSYDPLWSCVPVGTVILIYNDGDPNNQLPADDLSLADGNCSIVAPISSNLFETNSTTPGAVACDYPASGWTAGGNWTNIVMANGGDCFRIVDLSGCEVFSLCWDDNDQNNMIYFQGGATSTNSASNTVYYFNDGDPTDVANWSIGCADQPNCGQQDQTPGAPNNAQNADFIAQFNNGCNPITPIEVLANVDQNSSCSCDGQATATSSGSIPGYTYEWYDDLFNPIGQTGSVATGLCGGTYYVIGTSSIDCSDTAMVTLTSSGSGVSGLVAPLADTVQCFSLVAPDYLLFSDFLNDGGVLNGNISDVDTTSFGMISQSTDGLNCPETITRTYELTDSCGNVFTVDRDIVILDTTPPTGTGPAPVAVQCFGDVPAADVTAITDEADNCTANPTVTHVGDVSDGNTCPETITRTYRIEDDCGNFIEVDQTITVNDDTDPTGTAPAPVTVQCIGDVPAADVTAITDEADNCTAAPTVTHVGDVSDGLTCPETITRTYRIEDDCGNFIEVDQTITVNDDTAPTASNPATTTVECATDVPATDPTVVTDEADNCTANPTVTFVSEVSDNNVCNGEQLTRTYEIEDDCGNTTTVTHTIIIDSYTPTFTVAGTDPTQCGGTDGFITISGLDPNTDYEFSYNGGGTAVITTDAAGEYVITGLGSGSYTGFTVSDADCPSCSTTDPVTITLTDPNSPAVDAGPDQQVCEGSTVTLTADNPDGAIISWDNGVTDGTAFTPAVGTTTYTVTADLAGCINTDQVDVAVAPTIDALTCPGGLTAVCDISEQPAYADFDAFIADGGSATIPAGGVIDSTSFTLLSEVSDGNTCPETVTRTYQIADTCGVTVTCTQTIVINDLIDPTGTAPAPVSVQCIGDVPAADPTLITDEADNCTANPTVTHVGDVSDGLTCPETITRTYRIEDDCGNFIEVDQTITVNDDTDPTGTAPAPVTVQCIGDVPAADVTAITDEADNCTAAPTVTHVGDVSDGLTCPETITRTYRIEDDCGNFIEVDQTITVNDDTAPTASNPATTTVACASDVPAADPTVVTDEADNCTANPTVTFISETSDNNVCNGEELTRVYEIEDDCGNTTTVTHTIIIDSYTPTFTVAGTDPTQCGATDGFITISGLDPNTAYEISYNGNPAQSVNTDANGEYVITGLSAGSYTDFSVAPSSCVLCDATDATVINLVDPNAPAVDAGPDQEVCEGTEVTLTAGNPDGANISWDNGVTDGTPFTPSVGLTNYTVTADISGCTSTDVITVTVNALPNVDAGDDENICEGDLITLYASGAEVYVWDNGISNGVPFEPASTSTYSVVGTDINGCQNTDDVTVSVNTSSSIDFEADTTSGCVPLTVNFTNLTGGNSTECVYTFSDGTQLTGCYATHTFTSPGCYDVTLEVTNDNGCVSSMAITDYICVDEAPIAGFTFDPGELTNLNNTAQFNNNSSGAYSYEWQFGDGGTSTQVNPEHTYPSEEDEDYEVQLIAYSELGCTDTTTTILPLREELLFYVPNTFTPDQDDYNETFKPVFTSGFDPMNYTLLIFNRWGEVIFESNNAEVGWDGTYGASSEQIVKDGTYVWKIVFKTKNEDDHREAIGHVNLLK